MKPTQLLIILLLLLPIIGFTQNTYWNIDSLPERVEKDYPNFNHPIEGHITDYTTLRYKTLGKIKKLSCRKETNFFVSYGLTPVDGL